MSLKEPLLLVFLTICLTINSQKCRYSKDEFRDDVSIIETKSFIVAGVAGSSFKIRFGKKNDSYYVLMDYMRSISRKTNFGNFKLNFPEVECIDKNHKLVFILDNGEEIVLKCNERKKVDRSDLNPLFFEFFIDDLEYTISASDVEKLSSNYVSKIKLEYFKSDNTTIYKYRNDFNRLKVKSFSRLANCIILG